MYSTGTCAFSGDILEPKMCTGVIKLGFHENYKEVKFMITLNMKNSFYFDPGVYMILKNSVILEP
jgi:hypothetical protein